MLTCIDAVRLVDHSFHFSSPLLALPGSWSLNGSASIFLLASEYSITIYLLFPIFPLVIVRFV